jgi:hypothetical protein
VHLDPQDRALPPLPTISPLGISLRPSHTAPLSRSDLVLWSKPAVISPLESGLLYPNHRTFVVRVGTSHSCHSTCMGGLVSSPSPSSSNLSRPNSFIGRCAERQSKGGRRPSRSDLALDGREHSGTLVGPGESRLWRVWLPIAISALTITTIPRGARHQAPASRHTLVFVRSTRIGTMMQSYASAAKLQGGGPICS